MGHKRLSTAKVIKRALSKLSNKFQTSPSDPGLGTGPGTVIDFLGVVPGRIFKPEFFYLFGANQAHAVKINLATDSSVQAREKSAEVKSAS